MAREIGQRPWLIAVVALMCGAALGSSAVWLVERGTRSKVIPSPDLARAQPRGYLARRVWHARLGAGSVPEAVVSSVRSSGGEYGYHPVDLQVLSWDGIARRWRVVFDAQKVSRRGDPLATFDYDPESNAYIAAERFRWSLRNISGASLALIDPEANDWISKVAFADLGSGRGKQLVFSTQTTYGASGYVGALVIVSFRAGKTDVEYAWSGNGRIGFRVTGQAPRQRVVASASYWTPDDALCCPARQYRFTIGEDRNGTIGERADTRPWLGVYAKELAVADPRSPLRIVGLVYRSPAAKLLRPGDVLLRLAGAPRPKPSAGSPGLIDELERLRPRDTATFLVRRGGRTTKISVKLGSMADRSLIEASPPSGPNVATF